MTNAELASLIIERLREGEGCLHSDRVVGQAEADQLRSDFKQAENALAELVRRAEGQSNA